MESALCGESPSVCIGHGARDRMRIIEDFSLEQLIELNRLICERIAELRAQQDFDVLMQLRLGSRYTSKVSVGQYLDV